MCIIREKRQLCVYEAWTLESQIITREELKWVECRELTKWKCITEVLEVRLRPLEHYRHIYIYI